MGVLRFLGGLLPSLFSLKGSYDRPQFWTALLCGLAIIACSVLLLHARPNADSNLQGWIAVLSVTGAYVVLAASVKRGRDRGGRAILPTFFFLAGIVAVLAVLDSSGIDSIPGVFLSAIAAVFLIWLMIELGFRGPAGPPIPGQGGWQQTFVGVLRFFFSINGTFNRLQFWGAMLVGIAIFAACIAAMVRSETPDQAGVLPYLLPWVAVFIIYAAVLKRSRDRNGAGALPLVASPLAIPLAIGTYEKFGFYPSMVVGLLGIGLFVQAVTQLGFMGSVEPEPPEPDDWGEGKADENEDDESEGVPVN